MKAKKSYGQHFLTNEHYAERIADSLQLTDQYQDVLEVGPGKGVLTQYLLQKDFRLKVVEADRDMVAYLHEHFPILSTDIIEGDFLRVRLEDHFSGPFAIIGNYPYNISSQILLKTVKYRERVPEMAGMFQKEVADRVVAGPGSKTYGVIGILVQAFYNTEYLFGVSPGNFSPPPKVRSAVIRLTRKENPLVSDALWPVFRRIVKITFGQRRKMLRNTLKQDLSPARLQDTFFQQRPERLGLEEFVQIANWVVEEQELSED